LKPDVLKPDVLKPDILKPDILKPDVLWVYHSLYTVQYLSKFSRRYFKTCTGATAKAGQLGTSEFLVDTARSRLQELLV
jgi:hypothetical protein